MHVANIWGDGEKNYHQPLTEMAGTEMFGTETIRDRNVWDWNVPDWTAGTESSYYDHN